MSKTPPPPAEKKEKKPGFLDSFSGALNEVMNEVKADLAAMTPPEPKQDTKKLAERAAADTRILGLVGQASRGMAEEVSDDASVPVLEAEADPMRPTFQKPVPQGLPPGNMWENLSDPALANRFATDACYHALTVADVEGYARALGAETVAPFTLGVVAVGLQGHDAEEDDEPGDDLLYLSLCKALEAQPRLYGAVGAGPRQLWSNLEELDEILTARLNDNTKILALGPVGLDEPFAPYALAQQQEQLALQLDIAADFGLPVLLTHRQSLSALRRTLEGCANLPLLIYMEPLETQEQFQLVRDFGMLAVVRPELTNPAFAGAGFYRQLGAQRLLWGSGSALVAPHGFSGHFNQPKFLQNTLTAVAKLCALPEADMRRTLNATMAKVFYKK